MTQAEIDRLDMTDAGDRALEMIAGGALTKQICAELNVRAAALRMWLAAPTRAAEVARAREAGAAALVEEAKAIADCELPIIDPETFEAVNDVSRDKLRIQTRHWIAERVDRAAWGQQQQQLTINLNGLHLDALRSRSLPKADVVDLMPVDNSALEAL
jgi:hypothetical protein